MSTNDAALNALELRQADRQRVLNEWEQERQKARPLQCLDALDKFKKSISAFQDKWYTVNFLSAYDAQVLLRALHNVCGGQRESVAQEIEIATTQVKIDGVIRDFISDLEESAHIEQAELDGEGKGKVSKQMTLFDEMASQGVTTILQLQEETGPVLEVATSGKPSKKKAG